MIVCKVIDGQRQDPYPPFKTGLQQPLFKEQTIIKRLVKLIQCNEEISLAGEQTADMLDEARVQTKAPVQWEQVQDRWFVKHCQHT